MCVWGGCLDKAKIQGRRLEWDSQEMWAEGEGRLYHVLCYRAREEGTLDLEGRKESEGL